MDLLGKTDTLPDSGVGLLNEGGNSSGLGIAEDRFKFRSASGGNVGDNNGEVIVGASTECTETLQPGIDGGNCGTGGSLQENLEKTTGVKTSGARGSSDCKDGTLAFGGNAAMGNKMVRPPLNTIQRTEDGRT